MLTPQLKKAILDCLFGDPFVMDIEAEDMTEWISQEVTPTTTWEEFELIAWTVFDQHPWLNCVNTISSIWVANHHDPSADWGLKGIPVNYPEIHRIKERFDKLRIIRVRRAA